MKYRPDIDGLRAVAVIPVVLFHARISQVPGGFAGVDVFFVISGYLITGLILNDFAQGRFSILSFYERRARRILPALFAILLAASAAAYALLMPDRARSFGQSLVATVAFSSNVLFWKKSGYFQTSEVTPLLHTWSLAVEEQFYIMYPLFLFIVRRYLRQKYVLAILPVFIVSLALCIWGVNQHPSATFFLAPTRAWELLLGALLAISVIPPLRYRWMADVLGFSGLLLLTYTFAKLSNAVPFPGADALYPTLGAALIIYSGIDTHTLVARILSLRPVVFIGLISYSLYLWHWVVFAFLKSYLVRPLTAWELTAAIAVSFLLAGFSWKFVEGPFRGRRGRNTFSRRQIFAAGVLGSMLLAGLGGLLYRKQGLPSRFSSQVLAMYASKNDRWNRWGECSGKICPIGNTAVTPSFVLWGDSHAAAIAPLFEHLATVNNVSGFTAFDGSCVPLLGAKHYEEGTVERCARFQDSILTFIQTRHIRNVYLHARWAIYCEGTRYHQEEGLPVLLTANRNPRQNYAEFEYLFRSTIQELRRRQVNVVVIASVPEVGTDVPTALARSAARGLSVELRPRLSDFMERQARTFGVLSRVAAQNAVRVVYPHETFCDSSLCILTKENNILYMDDNHLSVHGAMLLASAVTPFLEKALSRGLQ